MTDCEGTELQVGDAVSTVPYRVIVEKIEDGWCYLAREGWRKYMLPGDDESKFLLKIDQEHLTNSFWKKQ